MRGVWPSAARASSPRSGRSAASAKRATDAGVTILADDAALIAEAELLLSIAPPSAAGDTTQRFRPLIGKAVKKPVYIDCNAIAPQTLHAIAKPFLDNRLPFIDGSIIGGPPRSVDGSSPRLYMSGPITSEAETLKKFGIDTRVLSTALGDASTLKMSYAGITKGSQALGSAMALGAGRNGALESLIAELKFSQPQIYAWLAKGLPSMYDKAYRWDGEMREIAKFLLPEQGSSANGYRRGRSVRAHRSRQPRRAAVGDHFDPQPFRRKEVGNCFTSPACAGGGSWRQYWARAIKPPPRPSPLWRSYRFA